MTSNNNTLNNQSTGTLLIVLGVLFIAMRILGFSFMNLLWPLWVLVPGLIMLFMGFRGEKANLGWNTPGALVAGTGAILFLLNMTGRWEAWSYMWALYPVFIGASLYYTGRQNQDVDMVAAGKTNITIGSFMLVGFGLFFELMVFGGFAFLDSALLPLLLIVGGAMLIFGKDRIKLGFLNFDYAKPKRQLKDPETGIDINLRHQMDEAINEEVEA